MEAEWQSKAISLLDDVEKSSSLHDWGSNKDSLTSTLAIVLKSLSEIKFPLSAEFMPRMMEDIKHHLSLRLKIEKEFKDSPNASQIAIKNPVFIIGPARSGSTLLHSLLSLDPLTRSPLLWEMKHPTSDLSKQERIAIATKYVEDTKTLTPGFFAMHHMDPLEPEECTQILGYDMFHVPVILSSGFMSDFVSLPVENHVAMFNFHKQVMQLLEFQNPHPSHIHWTFKSPLYTSFIRRIRLVYPDAKFIFLHRDPEEVISSSISIIQNATSWMFVGNKQQQEKWQPIRAKVLLANLAQRLLKTAEIIGEWEKEGITPVVHCQYTNLKRDPIAEIQRIYNELGREFTPEFKEKLELKWQQSKQYHPSPHSLEGTGITGDAIRAAFKPYYEKYFINNKPTHNL